MLKHVVWRFRIYNYFREIFKFREISLSVHKIAKCHFLPGGGLLKIGRIRYFFVDQKGGSKDFFKLKRGSLIFFKEIKYFVKHFRTQMEFLLILQKRCSFESVSCWNSSKRG